MSPVAQLARAGAIGIISVNNPPVNALGQALRQALLACFQAADRDPEIAMILLLCEGRTFIAGADIREFGQTPQAPSLPDVVNAIEALATPSLAVIHGNALGGGLEVAMACHYRIAERSAKLGLPEVNLGIFPGAGGTQRLPRLVGVEQALSMIVSGKPIGAPSAEQQGLLDALFQDQSPREAGLAQAQSLLDAKAPARPTSAQTIKGAEQAAAAIAEARAKAQQKQAALFSPHRAIDAIEAATQMPFAEGMQRERELFLECLDSPQRAALIHNFFAEREAGKVIGLSKDTPTREIQTVAVIGGGTMGVGITACFLNAGFEVTWLEINDEALERAKTRICDLYQGMVDKQRLSAEAMQQRLQRLVGVTDYRALSQVDLVVEAVFEDMVVKCEVFKQLDEVCPASTILATNTSYLDINHIANSTAHPERVVGAHFFSPAHIMRLLEVVRTDSVADEVLASMMKLAKRLKKIAVVAGVCDGFIGNRLLFHYARESEFLLEDGASPAEVDAAMKAFGMAMGPCAVRDLAGLEIGHTVRTRKRQQLGDEYPLPSLLDKLVERQWLGQKTQKGFYNYQEGQRRPLDNPELLPLLEEAAAARGLERQTPSEQEIVERCVLALINEGARVLEEGIAQRASDIDLVYTNGYGFPKHKGGPMFYANQVGLKTIHQQLCELEARLGIWWQPAPLIVRLAEQGGEFA